MAFRDTTNPTDLADEQMTVGGTIVYVARLTKKYRTKFAVIPDQRIIIILSVGDHKEVGLKE